MLDRFARQRRLELDPEVLDALSGRRLVNALSTALPFTPVEMQALLEARTVAERSSLLLNLMGMDLHSQSPEASSPPPTIH